MDVDRTKRLVLTVFAGASLSIAGGCQGGAAGADRGQAPMAGAPTEAAAAALDPVERSRLREAAISTLFELTTSPDPQVRGNAIEGMLPASARLDEIVPAALVDENVGVRAIAAMAVGRAKLRELTPAVRPLLADESPFVRGAAIYALRINGERVDPTPLGGMLTADPSPRVRSHAAFLLGELGDKGTSSMLRDAAQQEVPYASTVETKILQVQIAEALLKLGDTQQLHTIRAALYPSTPEEFDATVLAVQVLGGQRDRQSQGQLRNLALMTDGSGSPMPVEVRLAVAGALGGMGIPEFEPVALESLANGTEAQRIQAAWALGQIATPSAVRVLEGHLGDADERARVAVAAALLHAVGATGSR